MFGAQLQEEDRRRLDWPTAKYILFWTLGFNFTYAVWSYGQHESIGDDVENLYIPHVLSLFTTYCILSNLARAWSMIPFLRDPESVRYFDISAREMNPRILFGVMAAILPSVIS